jgi:hypothetical protein
MQESPGIFERAYWKAVIIVYPLISLTALTLYVTGFLNDPQFLLCLLFFLGLSSLISTRIQRTWLLLSRIEPEMNALYEQIRILEETAFPSPCWQRIRNTVRGADRQSGASLVIRRFRTILKRFDFRLNLLVFAFLNSFFLWDLRQMIALVSWKKKNKDLLDPWIQAVAETEFIISLACLARNRPGWCFPDVHQPYFNLEATDFGHPLIPEDKNVLNSFALHGRPAIAIVTGSNMAGKSTFLRSLGTNLVLAFMGAPVCARSFKTSSLQLLSSMRVADNLAENSSTFHAELKKLQRIIEDVNRGEPVFILLDEVLRGTNSGDRHAGTTALIRQLIRKNAVAVVATHDTGLAAAESEHNAGAVSNYHFDGRITGEELFFDYRLQKGICQSLNATLLMKKIGIHFGE